MNRYSGTPDLTAYYTEREFNTRLTLAHLTMGKRFGSAFRGLKDRPKYADADALQEGQRNVRIGLEVNGTMAA